MAILGASQTHSLFPQLENSKGNEFEEHDQS